MHIISYVSDHMPSFTSSATGDHYGIGSYIITWQDRKCVYLNLHDKSCGMAGYGVEQTDLSETPEPCMLIKCMEGI